MKGLARVVLAVCVLAGFCACGRAEPEETSAAATTTQNTTTTIEPSTTVLKEAEMALAQKILDDRYPDDALTVMGKFSKVEVQRIQEHGREFELTLHGFSGHRNGDIYDLETVYAIDIEEINGSFRQRLDGFATVSYYKLEYADYNNDGYLDIRLCGKEYCHALVEPSFFWLWNDDEGKYVRYEWLEQFGRVWVEDDGRLVSGKSGAWESEFSYYKFTNGKFIEMERHKNWFKYDGDDMLWGYEEVLKRVNGKMTLISQTKTKVEEP